LSDGGDELSSPSRYYSVANGRFTSMDPAAPTQMDPMSWNAYVGMGANPMLYIDADGRIKAISNGSAILSKPQDALTELAWGFQDDKVGLAGQAGVGVINALLNGTQIGMDAVNVVLNMQVLKQDALKVMMGGDATEFSNSLSELGGTAKTAQAAYELATTDQKYVAYDGVRQSASFAMGGEPNAFRETSETVAGVVIFAPGMGANPMTLTASVVNKVSAVGRGGAAQGRAVVAAAALESAEVNAAVAGMEVKPRVVMESSSGPSSVTSVVDGAGGLSSVAWVRPAGWRLPKNGDWAGVPGNSNFIPHDPPSLGLKPGDVVPFNQGRVDFSQYSKGNFVSSEALTGVHTADAPRMFKTIAEAKGWTQAHVKDWLRSEGLSAHHSGGNSFQLIPWELHGNPSAIPPINGVRHMSGAFDLRNPSKPN